jgi:hypothetical protein
MANFRHVNPPAQQKGGRDRQEIKRANTSVGVPLNWFKLADSILRNNHRQIRSSFPRLKCQAEAIELQPMR